MMPLPAAAFVPAPSACGVERSLAMALADELVALNGRLSELGFDLGGDADTVRKHMTCLQAIDYITQVQLAIADILRSEAPTGDRVGEVTLAEFADALRDRMAGQ